MGPLESPLNPQPFYEVEVQSKSSPNWLQGLSSVGGVVGGLAGAIGNIVQSRGDKKIATQNSINQVYSNASNLLQAKAIRDYNSPAEQMKRLEEAGINPNLAAGLVSGNTSQPFAVQPAGMSSPQGASAIGNSLRMLASQAREAYYDSKIKEEQYLDMKEQRELNNARKGKALHDFWFTASSLDDRLEALRLRNQLSEGNLTLLENKTAATAFSRWFAEWFVRLPSDKQESFFRSQYAQTLLDTAIKASISDVKSTEADFYKYNNHPAWKALQSLSFLFK